MDAYGRTLAYLYLDDGEYEHLYNEELIRLGLARTTLSHAYRREFGRLREEVEARGAGLCGACTETAQSILLGTALTPRPLEQP